jgi:hypothetical protein
VIRKSIGFSLVLLALLALPAVAELDGPPPAPQKLADQPGYVPFAELGLFSRDDASVEINLEGPLLRMVASGARGSDPDFASVIANLKSIQVRVFPVAVTAQETVKGKVGRATRWLEDRGWMPTLRVKESGDEAYIYLKEADGKIQGLTLLAVDADEATVINIVGRIDPEQIGRLGQALHMPQLEKAAPPKPKKDKP